MIPFSPPHIDKKTIDAVSKVLQSGWITTGKQTKLFEERITKYSGCDTALCLNSATAGLELILRWFGVKPGDEVILPAYTYVATANVIIHCGATPIFVDVSPNDFNISVKEIKKAITSRTKVIMPVDIAGYPCDYTEINKLVKLQKHLFNAESEEQQKLGRILILSDSAHSFGADYERKKTGSLTDISVFSFHAVKNITTAEGGAVAINLPKPFDNNLVYKQLNCAANHGQSVNAFNKEKNQDWRYDIVEAGYKYNMTDIAAAMGLVALEQYDSNTIVQRKNIVSKYNTEFSKYDWAQLPESKNNIKESCYHLYLLRIKNITENQRDLIIQDILSNQVSVNVHFIPIPMLTYYKNIGYNIDDFPISYDNFAREISLPVYSTLSKDSQTTVINIVIEAIKKHIS